MPASGVIFLAPGVRLGPLNERPRDALLSVVSCGEKLRLT
jgi:hypothetical protein